MSSNGQRSVSGVVNRVWEDGFSLDAGNRTFQVDTWDLYRDSTERFVSAGQELTVVGELEGGEPDAISIDFSSGGGGTSPAPGQSRDDEDIFGNGQNNVLRGNGRANEIRGRGGNDRLLGLGGGDDLFGDAGRDTLVGGLGNDDLFGGSGNDRLQGGDGQDDLRGGSGRDILIGNGGRDTFILEPRGNDLIQDFRDQIDEFELSGGLRFRDLEFRQQGNDTLIFADGDRLALVRNVDVASITQSDFD